MLHGNGGGKMVGCLLTPSKLCPPVAALYRPLCVGSARDTSSASWDGRAPSAVPAAPGGPGTPSRRLVAQTSHAT
eukprot:364612-Chlamydomonas_euryale.AAC.18